MRTLPVAEPNVKAFYAVIFDRHGILGKVNNQIFFFEEDGSITPFDPDMATWCTVLGQTDLADTQRVIDLAVHGGYAAVACGRRQEVR